MTPTGANRDSFMLLPEMFGIIGARPTTVGLRPTRVVDFRTGVAFRASRIRHTFSPGEYRALRFEGLGREYAPGKPQ